MVVHDGGRGGMPCKIREANPVTGIDNCYRGSLQFVVDPSLVGYEPIVLVGHGSGSLNRPLTREQSPQHYLIGLTLKRPVDNINKEFVISSKLLEGNY